MPTSTARCACGSASTPASLSSSSTPSSSFAGVPPDEVVEREQRVRLAAAEVGLQVDDRIAAAAVQALDGLR